MHTGQRHAHAYSMVYTMRTPPRVHPPQLFTATKLGAADVPLEA
jgi:hypothetical protein